MNRIDERFDQLKTEGKKALIAFLAVGDPDIEISKRAIYTMQEEGVDLIELGVPFSDPAADGPTIQCAYEHALENGTDIFRVLELVAEIRDNIEVPMVFLLYYNVVVQYGVKKFFEDCQKAGVDGLIIPDLPFEECDEIEEYTNKYGVYQIHFVSPTSKDRIKNITKNAKGFLYCIGVTDGKNSLYTYPEELVGEIKKHTSIPVCVGCDVSNGTPIKELKQYFDGVIAGSTIVKSIASGSSEIERMDNLCAKIKDLRSGLINN